MTVLATPNSPLSTAMREGSQAEHTAAENSAFMAELLGGRVNEPGLRRLPAAGCAACTPPWSPSAATWPTTRRSPPSTTPTSSGSPRSTPTSTTGPATAPATTDSPAARRLRRAHRGDRAMGRPVRRPPLHALPRRPLRRPGDRPDPRPQLRARRRRHRVLRLPRDPQAQALQGRLPRPPRRARR